MDTKLCKITKYGKIFIFANTKSAGLKFCRVDVLPELHIVIVIMMSNCPLKHIFVRTYWVKLGLEPAVSPSQNRGKCTNSFERYCIPFLAGQTLSTSYHYKSAPSPPHMMFKCETSTFSKHLLYMSIDLNAGTCSGTHGTAKSVLHLCILLGFYVLYTVSYKVDEID